MCRSRLLPFDWAEYQEWLLDRVMTPERMDYRLVLNTLFNETFYWDERFNDENRSVDGIDLRIDFADDTYTLDNPDKPCSVLEMMIALACRIEYGIMGEPGDDHPERWFWEMFDNIGLNKFTDDAFNKNDVLELIHGWMDRRYDRNGRPGFFPLKHAEEDQKKVEIWTQMGTYLNENYSLV